MGAIWHGTAAAFSTMVENSKRIREKVDVYLKSKDGEAFVLLCAPNNRDQVVQFFQGCKVIVIGELRDVDKDIEAVGCRKVLRDSQFILLEGDTWRGTTDLKYPKLHQKL